MKLLTYHGTIVQVTVARMYLRHAPLLDVECDFSDAEFPPPEAMGLASVLVDSLIDMKPGTTAGTVYLVMEGFYLCAEPNARVLKANRVHAGPWETFLPISDMDVAVLRYMLEKGWRERAPVNLSEAGSDVGRPVLVPGFGLRCGRTTIDLVTSRLAIASIAVTPSSDTDAILIWDRAPVITVEADIDLVPAPKTRGPSPLVGRTEFLEGTNRAVAVPAPADFMSLPVTVGPADTEFVLHRYWNGVKPQLGSLSSYSEARRAPGKFVLLQKGVAGIIFDQYGTYSNSGYLHTLNHCPPGLLRNGDTISVTRDLLDRAQQVAGISIVIFNPHMRNYYHWMIECVLSLDILLPYLPPGARIILPPEVAEYRATKATGFDHRRILDLLGFGSIPVLELESDVCLLEEAVWLENYMIHETSGLALRSFRDRIQALLGRPLPRNRRIYIQRTGLRSITNEDEVEAFCKEHGFVTYRLEDTDDDEQIRIFQEAEFVIATHGAALSNLAFCHEGTKVIEMSPDSEFRPFFWQIAEKLGLIFGVVPCSSNDGTFHGRVTADIEKLRALFHKFESWSQIPVG